MSQVADPELGARLYHICLPADPEVGVRLCLVADRARLGRQVISDTCVAC